MEHCESDVERQISIQGIHLSAFWNYFWKREGSFTHHAYHLQSILPVVYTPLYC